MSAEALPPLPPPEFSRRADLREINEAPLHLVATPEECAGLARRFGLVAVVRLEADIALAKDGAAVLATGRLSADIVQPCAVSGEDLAAAIREAVSMRFVPARAHGAVEVELDAEALDEIEFTGSAFDLGEALAQTLGLAIDPFAVGPGAERARALLGAEAAGPFAGLAGLKLGGA